MVRPKTIDGEKFIKIRVTRTFYEFIKLKSKELGIPTISEFCRSALEMICMSLYLKKDVKIGSIEHEFWKRYGQKSGQPEQKSGTGDAEEKV